MTSIPLDHELDDGVDGSRQLEEVVPRLGALVAQVRPGDMVLATPCLGWTTRDLLNHVVGGALMFADAFGGGPLHDISGRLADVVADDPAAAFGSAAARFGAGAQQPGAMERVLVLPWGAMTGRTFLRFAAFDLLVHAWDLSVTLDADLDVPDDLVADVDAFARRVLGPWQRDDVNFAAVHEVGAGASPMQRLVAFTGRAA